MIKTNTKLLLTFLIVIAYPACDLYSQSKIEVSFDKSVMLVFDHAINPSGTNCGQKELVGVRINGNKLILQAKEEYFEETNLIIELTDGSLYAFDLVYNNAPKNTFHVIKVNQASYVPEVSASTEQEPQVVLSSTSPKQKSSEGNSESKKKEKGNSGSRMREQIDNITSKVNDAINPPKKETSKESSSIDSNDLVSACEKIVATPDYLKRIGIINKKMFLYVGGIYVSGDKLFFKVNVKNVSSIPYDVDYSQFLVKSVKSGLSRNASPLANRVKTIYVREPETITVGQNEIKTWVYVFEKFTIAEDKKLFVEFWEKNGDRNLEIPIESVEILNAKNNL